jgi:C1A family cysteine protease
MLTGVGYRTNPDGSVDFLILNSWGTGWGNGGLCWMSSNFIASTHVFDRYVVTAAPSSR